jgi:hypothetical protein
MQCSFAKLYNLNFVIINVVPLEGHLSPIKGKLWSRYFLFMSSLLLWFASPLVSKHVKFLEIF